jgi:hypothetical protein
VEPGNATQQFSELRTESLLQGDTAQRFYVHILRHVHDQIIGIQKGMGGGGETIIPTIFKQRISGAMKKKARPE